MGFLQGQDASFRALPMMEVDGEPYAQVNALLRYAGRLGNLLPRDPLLVLRIDQLISAADELFYDLKKIEDMDDQELKLQK